MRIHLKDLAVRAGYKSLVTLGAEVGLSQRAIYMLANGKAASIKLRVLEELCRRLSCRPNDLLELAPDKEATQHQNEAR